MAREEDVTIDLRWWHGRPIGSSIKDRIPIFDGCAHNFQQLGSNRARQLLVGQALTKSCKFYQAPKILPSIRQSTATFKKSIGMQPLSINQGGGRNEFCGEGPLLLVGVIHAIGVLLPGNGIGEILNFQVGLQKFDVQQLALGRGFAIRPHLIERQVAIMCLDESVHQQWIHIRILRFCPFVPLLGQSLSSCLLRAYALTLSRYLACTQIKIPRQPISNGPTGNDANERLACTVPSRTAQIAPAAETKHPNRDSQKEFMGGIYHGPISAS